MTKTAYPEACKLQGLRSHLGTGKQDSWQWLIQATNNKDKWIWGYSLTLFSYKPAIKTVSIYAFPWTFSLLTRCSQQVLWARKKNAPKIQWELSSWLLHELCCQSACSGNRWQRKYIYYIYKNCALNPS